MGWTVLQQAGLTAQKRSTLLGVSRGHEHLPLSSISKALRNQWEDAELRERDRKSFCEANFADDEVGSREDGNAEAHCAEHDAHHQADWEEKPGEQLNAYE